MEFQHTEKLFREIICMYFLPYKEKRKTLHNKIISTGLVILIFKRDNLNIVIISERTSFIFLMSLKSFTSISKAACQGNSGAAFITYRTK